MDLAKQKKTVRVFWTIVAAVVILSMVGFLILPALFR